MRQALDASKAVGDALADAYNALHDEELSMFPDARAL
jgi:hypothetical protein